MYCKFFTNDFPLGFCYNLLDFRAWKRYIYEEIYREEDMPNQEEIKQMQELFDDDGSKVGIVKGLSKSDQKLVEDDKVPQEALDYFREQHREQVKVQKDVQ